MFLNISNKKRRTGRTQNTNFLRKNSDIKVLNETWIEIKKK